MGVASRSNANVLEVVGIPQGIEIALESADVIDIAGAGKMRARMVSAGNAAIAVDLYGRDYILLAHAGDREQDANQPQGKERALHFPPTTCK